MAAAVTYGLEVPAFMVLKNLIKRPRPADSEMALCAFIKPAGRFSFPSGHTAAAFVMATLLGIFYPVVATLGGDWVPRRATEGHQCVCCASCVALGAVRLEEREVTRHRETNTVTHPTARDAGGGADVHLREPTVLPNPMHCLAVVFCHVCHKLERMLKKTLRGAYALPNGAA